MTIDVKKTRESLEFTQEQLAHYLGVSTRTIQRYENCDFPVPFAVQKLLEKVTKDGMTGMMDYVCPEEIMNSFNISFAFDVEYFTGSNVRESIILCANLSPEYAEWQIFTKGDTAKYSALYLNSDMRFTTEGCICDESIFYVLDEYYFNCGYGLEYHGIGFDIENSRCNKFFVADHQPIM